MVALGVGKNMVRAIRFWADAAEVAIQDKHESGLTISEFGKTIFGPHGHDEFLEDIRTLWLIHWKFSTNAEQPLFAWHFLLNFWHRPDFTRSEILAAFAVEAQRAAEAQHRRFTHLGSRGHIDNAHVDHSGCVVENEIGHPALRLAQRVMVFLDLVDWIMRFHAEFP